MIEKRMIFLFEAIRGPFQPMKMDVAGTCAPSCYRSFWHAKRKVGAESGRARRGPSNAGGSDSFQGRQDQFRRQRDFRDDGAERRKRVVDGVRDHGGGTGGARFARALGAEFAV